MTNLLTYLQEKRDRSRGTEDLLVIRNLTKIYRRADGSEFLALEDINLTIKENEFVAVIGHSGCGKSTLLKIAAGTIEPDDARARFQDADDEPGQRRRSAHRCGGRRRR